MKTVNFLLDTSAGKAQHALLISTEAVTLGNVSLDNQDPNCIMPGLLQGCLFGSGVCVHTHRCTRACILLVWVIFRNLFINS